MPTIDTQKWATRAEPQREGKNWCWAACLAATCRYQVADTLIAQEQFVVLSQAEQPDWNQYMAVLKHLLEKGVQYSRTNAGRRMLNFDLDMKHNLDPSLALTELQAGFPVIVNCKSGAHDLVIVSLETNASEITHVRYWNPFDNGIGYQSLSNFLKDWENLTCTIKVRVKCGMEMIPFVKASPCVVL